MAMETATSLPMMAVLLPVDLDDTGLTSSPQRPKRSASEMLPTPPLLAMDAMESDAPSPKRAVLSQLPTTPTPDSSCIPSLKTQILIGAAKREVPDSAIQRIHIRFSMSADDILLYDRRSCSHPDESNEQHDNVAHAFKCLHADSCFESPDAAEDEDDYENISIRDSRILDAVRDDTLLYKQIANILNAAHLARTRRSAYELEEKWMMKHDMDSGDVEFSTRAESCRLVAFGDARRTARLSMSLLIRSGKHASAPVTENSMMHALEQVLKSRPSMAVRSLAAQMSTESTMVPQSSRLARLLDKSDTTVTVADLIDGLAVNKDGSLYAVRADELVDERPLKGLWVQLAQHFSDAELARVAQYELQDAELWTHDDESDDDSDMYGGLLEDDSDDGDNSSKDGHLPHGMRTKMLMQFFAKCDGKQRADTSTIFHLAEAAVLVSSLFIKPISMEWSGSTTAKQS